SFGSAIGTPSLRSVAHHDATVDVQGLPRHVVGVGAREERYHIRDVLRALGTAEGNTPDAALPRLPLPQPIEGTPLAVDLLPHRSLDGPRAHTVRGDPLRRQHLGGRACEADHARL